jgi:23S rRNA pseudouridine2605 synthase
VATPEGETLAGKAVRILRSGGRTAWLEVVLDEGRHRHIRRMLAAREVETLRLIRVSIGPLTLGTLGKGEVRALTPAERAALADAGR